MITILQKHRQLWSQRDFLLSLVSGIALLIIGGAFLLAARAYLMQSYLHTAGVPDLFLDLLPAMQLQNFLVWGVPLLIGFIACILFLYPERFPFSLKAVGLFFLIRSFFIILTPLGIRPDQVVTSAHGFFQSLAYNGNDFFFSGHVSFPFLFALIFWKEVWVRTMMLVASGLFGMGVLLAHTHYSIDVFAVPFMVSSIHRFSLFLFQENITIRAMARHERQPSMRRLFPSFTSFFPIPFSPFLWTSSGSSSLALSQAGLPERS